MNILAARLANPGLRFLYENLGLATIAGVLRDAGHECRVVDAIQEDMGAAECIRALAEAPERVICVSIHSEQTADRAMRMTTEVKRLSPEKIIVVGGHPVATVDTAIIETYPKSFDYLVRGEGENTVLDLVGHLSDGTPPLSEIPGVTYMDGDRPIRNPRRQRVDAYSPTPRAARDVWRNGKRRPETESALVWLSRGCDYGCTFCSLPGFHGDGQRSWRTRELDDFVGELDDLAKNHGILDFTIVDPNFIGTRSRPDEFVREFCDAVSGSGLDLIFDVATRADSLTPGRIDALCEAGMRRVFVGVESGVDAQLQGWRKELAPDESRRAIQALTDAGVYVSVGFIMLTPETTIAGIRDNIAFLKSLPDFGYYCLDKRMWALHRTARSFTVDATHLEPAAGRIYRTLAFGDRRVAEYRGACGVLADTLGPFFDVARERLWRSMGRDTGAIRLHSSWNREMVLLYTELVEQSLATIERGVGGEALTESIAELAARHERVFGEGLGHFVSQIDARYPADARRGAGGLDLDGLTCRNPV